MPRSTSQLHSILLISSLPLIHPPFDGPGAHVDQERREHETYDCKEGCEDRVRFLAAQALEAFRVDAGTDGRCVTVVVGLASTDDG